MQALAQEKEDRLAELHARVQALELERAQLGSRCSLLEKVLTLKSEGKDISEQVCCTAMPLLFLRFHLLGSAPQGVGPRGPVLLSVAGKGGRRCLCSTIRT